MPKKIVFMLPLFFAACDVAPLTPYETDGAVSHIVVAQSCFQRGWVNNPSILANYLTSVQSHLANNGDPALIAQSENRLVSAAIRMEDCRFLEMTAMQFAQEQAEQRRQQESFNNSMDRLSQSTQQMQAQSQPRSVTCNYVQWGNMTTCSAY